MAAQNLTVSDPQIAPSNIAKLVPLERRTLPDLTGTLARTFRDVVDFIIQKLRITLGSEQ